MSPRARFLWTLVAVFFAFYIFTQPVRAADTVGGAFGKVEDGANSLITFFDHLDDES
jgi:hypothetical protein